MRSYEPNPRDWDAFEEALTHPVNGRPRINAKYHDLYRKAAVEEFAWGDDPDKVCEPNESLVSFVEKTSKWFPRVSNWPNSHTLIDTTFVTPDGELISWLYNSFLFQRVTTKQVAVNFLGHTIKEVLSTHALILENISSVSQAIELVEDPTDEMIVAIFEHLRNRESNKKVGGFDPASTFMYHKQSTKRIPTSEQGTVTGRFYRSSITGYRPNMIVIDDVVKDTDYSSIEKRILDKQVDVFFKKFQANLSQKIHFPKKR